jgi:hypothetical protein
MIASKDYSSFGERITLGLYGYEYRETSLGKLPALNKSQGKVIERVFSLFLSQRLSFKKIADKLNKETNLKPLRGKHFSQMQIKRILSHPEYCGMVVDPSNGKFYDSPYFDAIVSKEQWIKVQMNLPTQFKKTGGYKKIHFPLSGLVYCSLCGAQYYSKGNKYYYCKHTTHRDGGKCGNSHSYLSKAKLEELILTAVRYTLFDFNNLSDIKETIDDDEIKGKELESNFLELKEQIVEKQKQLEYVVDSHKDDTEEIYLVEEQIDRLKTELGTIIGRKNCSLEREIEKYLHDLSPLDKIARYELVHSLVKEIKITNDYAKIFFFHGIPLSIKIDNLDEATKRVTKHMEDAFQNLSKRKEDNNLSIYIMKMIRGHKSSQEIEDEEFIDFLHETQIEEANRRQRKVKIPLNKNKFLNIRNTHITMNLHDLFRFNGIGGYYINLLNKDVSVDIVERNNTVFAIRVNGETYIWEKAIYIQSPDSLPREKHRFLQLDGEYFYFVVEKGSIRAYSRIGETETDRSIESVIDLIGKSKSVVFIE